MKLEDIFKNNKFNIKYRRGHRIRRKVGDKGKDKYSNNPPKSNYINQSFYKSSEYNL